VLVDVIAVHMMQMAIVQVVDMTAVAHGSVPTSGSMDVVVIGVGWVGASHFALQFLLAQGQRFEWRIVAENSG
jgi:hypothetical protein